MPGRLCELASWRRVSGLVALLLIACCAAPSPQHARAANVDPPVNQTPPSINGDVRVGSLLTADPGTWTNSTGTFTYQWSRCTPGCTPIPGATNQTYTPTDADAGAQLRVDVTATSSTNDTATASATTSGGVKLRIAPVPGNTGLPTIAGEARGNETLTGTVGLWTEGPTSFELQWLRCATAAGADCAPIPGQTAAAYHVTRADVGSTVRLQVVARNANGPSSPALSAPTGLVQPEVIKARLNVVPSPTCTGVTTRLDGSASTTPNGPILRYRFTYREVPLPLFIGAVFSAALTGGEVDLDKPPFSDAPSGVLFDGSTAAPTTTFNWNRQLSQPELQHKPGDFVRDPLVLYLTVTDQAGASSTTAVFQSFAQLYSSDSRAKCPRVLRIRDFATRFAFGAFSHVTTTASGVGATLPCRSTIACSGRVQVVGVAGRASAAAAQSTTLADSGVFRIAAHKSRTVRAAITRAGRRLLRPHRRVRARLRITSINASGHAYTRTFAVTLKRTR